MSRPMTPVKGSDGFTYFPHEPPPESPRQALRRILSNLSMFLRKEGFYKREAGGNRIEHPDRPTIGPVGEDLRRKTIQWVRTEVEDLVPQAHSLKPILQDLLANLAMASEDSTSRFWGAVASLQDTSYQIQAKQMVRFFRTNGMASWLSGLKNQNYKVRMAEIGRRFPSAPDSFHEWFEMFALAKAERIQAARNRGLPPAYEIETPRLHERRRRSLWTHGTKTRKGDTSLESVPPIATQAPPYDVTEDLSSLIEAAGLTPNEDEVIKAIWEAEERGIKATEKFLAEKLMKDVPFETARKRIRSLKVSAGGKLLKAHK